MTTLYRPATSSSGDSSIAGDLVVTGDGTVTQDLTIDTTTLFVDSANDRVGVGTITPSALLDVSQATDGATIRITSLQNNSAHSSSAPYGKLEFYSADASGPAGPRVEVGCYPVGTNGSSGEFVVKTASGSATPTERMRLDQTGRLGLNVTEPLALMHVDQNSPTGAIPVLYLDQADVSEEFIRFAATEATGNAIEDVGAKTLTTTKFVRVNVNGTDLYFQAGTIA